jgi:hypothetical protein
VAIGGEKGIVSVWDVKSGRAKLSNTRVDESVVPNQTITALMYALCFSLRGNDSNLANVPR